jgi:hypothetical protein
MQGIIDYLSQYEWFRSYLDYVLHMSTTELLLFVAITAVLLSFIFYRWFGIGGLSAIVVFMFLIYIVIRADFYGSYLQKQYDDKMREEMYQRELSKDQPGNEVGGSIGGKAED